MPNAHHCHSLTFSYAQIFGENCHHLHQTFGNKSIIHKCQKMQRTLIYAIYSVCEVNWSLMSLITKLAAAR